MTDNSSAPRPEIRWNRSKLVLALVCISVGWIVGYTMGKKEGLKMARHHDSPFLEMLSRWAPTFSVFDHRDNREDSHQDSIDDDERKGIDAFSLFGKRLGGTLGGSAVKMEQREDADFIYVDIIVSDLQKDSLEVKVENGMINIQGVSESKDSGGSGSYQSNISSSFYQSFPAPHGADGEKVDIVYEKGKVVLKFSKIKEK